MKKIGSIFVALYAFAFIFALPATVLAAENCVCWCGLEGAGAVVAEGPTTIEGCRAGCDTANMEFLTCAEEGDYDPTNNLICWSETECATAEGIWGDDIPKDCTDNTRYCYNQAEPVKLGVAVGGISTVNDIGEYVNAFYKWTLSAGVIVATVIIMVGGVQYMVGKGSGNVQKAKDRIRHAVIGFVLLLGAYIILATVNPQLVSLEIPTFPKVKTVHYLGDEDNCDKLIGHGYKVELENGTEVSTTDATIMALLRSGQTLGALGKSSLSCGTEATVTAGPGDSEVEEDKTCFFTYCPTGEGCIPPSAGEPPECIGCTDIVGFQAGKPQPSESTCSMITYPNSGNTKRYCVYSQTGLLSPLQADDIKAHGGCGELTVDCSSISSCRDYDEATVSITATKVVECVSGAGIAAFNPSIFSNLCNSDPCNVAPDGQSCGPKFTYLNDVSEAFQLGPLPASFYPGLPNVQWDCVNTNYKETGCLDKDNKDITCWDVEGTTGACLRF